MLIENETLSELRARFPAPGIVSWLGIRPKPRGALHAREGVRLLAGRGIEGDHRARRGGGKRQVTLIQDEHLEVVASLMGDADPALARPGRPAAPPPVPRMDPARLRRIDPVRLRRNIVVRGLNLMALKGVRFRLGGALLEGTGACHPCSRMEQILGPGGYNAMRGHGGITAIVLEDGDVALGDLLDAVAGASPPGK
jgi:MOSC domain-containing protein YiiM